MNLVNLLAALTVAVLLVSACNAASLAPSQGGPGGTSAPPAASGSLLAQSVDPREFRPPAGGIAQPAARGERPPPAVVRIPAATPPPVAAGKRLQVGFGRDVPATADVAATARLLRWQRGARASAAAITFQVEGARGLRVGVLVRRLPPEAVLRGYVGEGPTLFEVPARHVLDLLQANRNAGDRSDEGATWWAPVTQGPELTLEIALPAGTAPESVEIAVPKISQLTQP